MTYIIIYILGLYTGALILYLCTAVKSDDLKTKSQREVGDVLKERCKCGHTRMEHAHFEFICLSHSRCVQECTHFQPANYGPL